jgi:hypothetical protein
MFSEDHVHGSRKLAVALTQGATAFIISNPWDDSNLVSGDASCEIPAFGFSKRTGEALVSASKCGERVHFMQLSHSQTGYTQTLDWFHLSDNTNQGGNDKEIIVCAHIDGHAVSQSAMDNASGVAVALALAAQINCIQTRSNSLRIVIFSAEERGLVGSEKYVASPTESEKRKIQAVINLDCIGGSTKLCAMTSKFNCLRKVAVESSKISGITVEIF